MAIDPHILRWAEILEDYARDWDEVFGHRPDYFTQEFWYLLVGVWIADARGAPLTVSRACQLMKTGSNRTREDRLKRAVDDGYLVKERDREDGRVATVRPTPQLEALMRRHFERTFANARALLANTRRRCG
jgi:hypothetical protein